AAVRGRHLELVGSVGRSRHERHPGRTRTAVGAASLESATAAAHAHRSTHADRLEGVPAGTPSSLSYRSRTGGRSRADGWTGDGYSVATSMASPRVSTLSPGRIVAPRRVSTSPLTVTSPSAIRSLAM